MTGAMPVRVMVEDAWDEVALEVPETTPLGELKRAALDLTRVQGNPSGYVLKYRGAEISDEGSTLRQAGVIPNSALIVLSRRRRPVR